jgi:hypothetical protein
MVGMKCPSGKHRHATYAAALAAHMEANPDGLGSVYLCPHCDEWHVTRRFGQDFKRRSRRRDRIKAFKR